MSLNQLHRDYVNGAVTQDEFWLECLNTGRRWLRYSLGNSADVITGDNASGDRDDICQNALINAFLYMKDFEPSRSSFRSWLFLHVLQAKAAYLREHKRFKNTLDFTWDIGDIEGFDYDEGEEQPPPQLRYESNRGNLPDIPFEDLNEEQVDLVEFVFSGYRRSEIVSLMGITVHKYRKIIEEIREIVAQSP